MSSRCRKFVPNVFDVKKCQNCFKSKDYHARSTPNESASVKKVVACSYLFISPHGLDFRNVIDRSKRWQRRFFVLHDDGELLFSIDENSQAIPQGRIHLSSCRSVHSGEEITGHANSIALHLENGESYFLRAPSREEMLHWEKLLCAFCPAHQKQQQPSPLQRFQKFSRSISGPLVAQPQPPPRQQPPKPQKTPPTASSPGTTKVCGNHIEYIETDLDYDLSASNSKSANSSPFASKAPATDSRLRRRPGSVGDQLKSLLNSPGAGSPHEDRSSADSKELTYLKKGWLYVRAPTDPDLQKRWCVLSDGCVTIYLSSLDEDHESPEFALPLLPEGKSPVRLHESAPDLTYGFVLETAVGNRFAFAAMTAGIRSNWVQALRTCLRLRTTVTRGANIRRVPAMRRHTTGASVASGPSSADTNGSDMCDAEVSQILTKKSKFDEQKVSEPSTRAYTASKSSLDSSVAETASQSLRSGRNSRDHPAAEAEAAALRARVTELNSDLEAARSKIVDLQAKLSMREAECLGLSDQCQRLELDVFERERIVSLPTDEERQLKRQLAAHDEALRASHERCERAERCVDEINERLTEQLAAADEELARALRERDEATKERAAAVADRDALERRWKAERSHWEAALAQNEADNARLETERRQAEDRLASAHSAARELEAAAELRTEMTLGELGLPDGLLDEATVAMTVEAMVVKATELRKALAAKEVAAEAAERFRDRVTSGAARLSEELRRGVALLRPEEQPQREVDPEREPLGECQALAETLVASLGVGEEESSLAELFHSHLAPALRAADASTEDRANKRLAALLAVCGARLAREAAGGVGAATLEAAAVAAAERLASVALPASWCLAAAVGLRQSGAERAVRPLRALCRRRAGQVVRWFERELQSCLLQEEAVALSRRTLLHAAERSLERCCAELRMARPQDAERRITWTVGNLLAGAEAQEDEEEEKEEELARVPTLVMLLALLEEPQEEAAAEPSDPPGRLRNSLLSEKEWREASLAAVASCLESSHLAPLQKRLQESEEQRAAHRADLAERDLRLRDLETALWAKDSEIAAAREAMERADRLSQEKARNLSLDTPTNGRRDPPDEVLRFWRRELRAVLADELRAASPPLKDGATRPPTEQRLQAQLEAEREAHQREVTQLRSDFEAALAEEARQTRLAIEAIARQHQEALERERQRLTELREGEPLASWLSQAAVENHLETIAKRLAALPRWENGASTPEE